MQDGSEVKRPRGQQEQRGGEEDEKSRRADRNVSRLYY